MKYQNFKNTGKNSVQIGQARNVNVHINDFEEKYESPNFTRKVKLNTGIKPKQISFISTIAFILGIVSSIITIVGLFKQWNIKYLANNSLFFTFSFSIGVIFLFFISKLKRTGFLSTIPLLGNTYIEIVNGKIAFTSIISECPQCKAQIRIFKDEGNYKAFCTRNSSHNFDFDYTKF